MEQKLQIFRSTYPSSVQPPQPEQSNVWMHNSLFMPKKTTLCKEFKARYIVNRDQLAKTAYKFGHDITTSRKINNKSKRSDTDSYHKLETSMFNDEVVTLPKIECTEVKDYQGLKSETKQELFFKDNTKCLRYLSYKKPPHNNQSLSITAEAFKQDKNVLLRKSTKPKTSYRNELTNQVTKKNQVEKTKQIERIMRTTLQNKGLCDRTKAMGIRDYNRRCGYSQNSKIFIFNSQDEYIRRILLRRGWVQNMTNQSSFYHLRWTYLPILTEHIRTDDHQYENHYKNSRQLTSKSHLTNHLKANQSSFGRIDDYYPKCFEIGNAAQTHTFIEEYRYQIMLILLQKIYGYCREKQPTVISQYTSLYDSFYGTDQWMADPLTHKRYKEKSIFCLQRNSHCHSHSNSRNCKNNTHCNRKCHSKNHHQNHNNTQFRTVIFEDFKNRDDNYLLNMNLVIEGLRYWRFHRKNKQQVCDSHQHPLHYKSRQFMLRFESLEKYSLLDDISKPIPNITEFKRQFYATPSKLLLQRICKQYTFLKNIGEITQVYGVRNVWIVKPASTSRGYGIYLASDLSSIVHSTKGVQSRMVQKYIEKPLIIRDMNYPQISHRKFDIRQWVLLKSLNPLRIYMFSHCYLRLCYSEYDLSDLNDPSKHLTNYSLNKHRFGSANKSASVLPITYLIEFLEKNGVCWHTSVREQIKDIIVKSVKSCEQALEEGSERGNFALLGYDILLDQHMKPWLLEVNMSPACEERTEWLSEYLQKMGESLLNIVLEDFEPGNQQPDSQSADDSFTELRQSLFDQYQWQLIHEQVYGPNKRDTQICLEIQGKSVKLANERHIDWLSIANQSAFKIQKFMKKYIPKYVRHKHHKNKCVCLIDKYLKGVLAFYEWRCRVRQNKIDTIHSYFEVKLAAVSYKRKSQRFYLNRLNVYVWGCLQQRVYYKEAVQMQIIRRYQNAVFSFSCVRQLKNMCREIQRANNNSMKIQRKCRQFLSRKNQQKYFFKKYFSTVVTYIHYIELSHQQKKQTNTSIISKHLKSIVQTLSYHKQLRNYHLHRLSTYIRCITYRQQLYTRKLQIFYYIVGRILRVKKKRIRGNQLRIILIRWKHEKDRLNVNKLAQYLMGFHAVIQKSKLKSQVRYRVGRIVKRQRH